MVRCFRHAMRRRAASLALSAAALATLGCSLTCNLCSLSGPLATQPPQEVFIVEVQADRGWQETSASVRAEQAFRVEYISGEWTAWDGTIPPHDAAGTGYVCGDADTCCEPMPGYRKEALIGRVGDEFFPIGNGGTFTPQSNGVLYLRMNDCDDALADNAGSVVVRVRIDP